MINIATVSKSELERVENNKIIKYLKNKYIFSTAAQIHDEGTRDPEETQEKMWSFSGRNMRGTALVDVWRQRQRGPTELLWTCRRDDGG